jgi:hypothetical protein
MRCCLRWDFIRVAEGGEVGVEKEVEKLKAGGKKLVEKRKGKYVGSGSIFGMMYTRSRDLVF